MFYSQCNDCNQRWELGTASTCKCPKQEPVAWEQFYPDMGKPQLTPPQGIYYTPPQRTWVGLTDEDLGFLFPHGKSVWLQETVKIIEAKLRSKNEI